MKHLPAPTPLPKRPSRRLDNDPQVKAWIRRMLADEDAAPHELGEEQLAYIADRVFARRGMQYRADHLNKAIRDTCPVLSVPDVTDPIVDLSIIFSLPEMQDFWQDWQAQPGARGPALNALTRKALYTTMAFPGWTTHACHANTMLERMPDLRAVFERVDRDARVRRAERRGVTLAPAELETKPMTLMNPKAALKHRGRFAKRATDLALQTNVDLLKDLRRIHGDRIGKGWLLDCTPIPAWAPQRGADHFGGDEERQEAHDKILRTFSPEAGFRAVRQLARGKETIPSGPGATDNSALRSGKVKTWRGYYLAALVEQATGLPGAWMVFDAKKNEPTALIELLSLLHQLWPDVGMEWLAADSGFDIEWCARACERDYGVHPIFRLHDERRPVAIPEGTVRGNKLVSLAHNGRLTCGAHMEELKYDSFESPSRANLRPGQPTDGRAFRYRAKCAQRAGGSCGRLSIPASFDWRRLTYYPHHGAGRPELHAFRQAILTTRMGQIESLFGALKSGYKIGGSGGGRQRIREREVHEALISLAFLSRTALTVADQRIQIGELDIDPLRGPEPPEPPRRTGPKPRTAAVRKNKENDNVVELPAPVPDAEPAGPEELPAATAGESQTARPSPAREPEEHLRDGRIVRRRGHLGLIIGERE